MATDREALLLQVSADVSRLQKQFDKAQGIVNTGSKAMERRAQQASTTLEKFFGKADLGKSLDSVFDATRFKVLDSGIARVGLFGSALETLGPAGLIAAAGIGAVAAAFSGARDAAKFADDISDTANRLHVTTDALQEYRYAIRAAGGEQKGADEALEGFSETLGRAQQGLVKGQRAFLALGFTKEQIKGFQDTGTALDAVIGRLQNLPSQQRDAIIKQFGLDGLKPLLDGGVDKVQTLRAEAHKLGIVMDAELVKRGGELNDQFETVAGVIDLQLKSALVDLGPVLLVILGKMAELAKLAADVADSFRGIDKKGTDHLQSLRAAYEKQLSGPMAFMYGDNARKQIGKIDTVLAARAADGAVAPPKPTGHLVDTSKTPEQRDTTDQQTESVKATLAQANRDLLNALGRLTADIDERARIEREVAGQELAAELARLEKQKATLDADKGLDGPTKTILKSRLDEAETAAKKAAQAKVDLIAREQDWALEDRADETRKQLRDAEIASLEVQATMATTQAERSRIEQQILKLKQNELIHESGKDLSRQEQTGAITDEEGAQRSAALAQRLAAERAQLVFNQAGPVEQYLRSLQDVNTEMQTAGVQAAQSLSDGLADAIINAHSLGSVASNVFRQLLQQILSSAIQKNFAAPILAAAGLPGFAGGTDFSPGGLALVGEKGPELVNLPLGSKVLSNPELKGFANGVRGDSAQTLSVNMTINAQDAVLTAQVRQWVHEGVVSAVTSSRQLVGADLSRSSRRRL